MTDPSPAAGGLSEDEQEFLRHALDVVWLNPELAEAVAAFKAQSGPSAHPVLTHPNGDKCIWLDDEWFVPLDTGGEGYACPHEHPAARTEAADRELARVTAAVGAAISALRRLHIEYGNGVAGEVAAALRAALSSADATALDDLLDRERAKAAGAALREAADAWLAIAPATEQDGPISKWLRDRAAAVSPEGGSFTARLMAQQNADGFQTEEPK